MWGAVAHSFVSFLFPRAVRMPLAAVMRPKHEPICAPVSVCASSLGRFSDGCAPVRLCWVQGYVGWEDEEVRRFEGALEDLLWGGLPIGLWNFQQRHGSLEGCQERDTLTDLPVDGGLRFDGTGYALLGGEPRDFADGISISLTFRTYAREGLLFLIHNGPKFMALELRDGHVVYKFDLGSGLTQVKSNAAYNNGKWHQLRAAQFRGDADLTVSSCFTRGPFFMRILVWACSFVAC